MQSRVREARRPSSQNLRQPQADEDNPESETPTTSSVVPEVPPGSQEPHDAADTKCQNPSPEKGRRSSAAEKKRASTRRRGTSASVRRCRDAAAGGGQGGGGGGVVEKADSAEGDRDKKASKCSL